jgi:hypothetical protein
MSGGNVIEKVSPTMGAMRAILRIEFLNQRRARIAVRDDMRKVGRCAGERCAGKSRASVAVRRCGTSAGFRRAQLLTEINIRGFRPQKITPAPSPGERKAFTSFCDAPRRRKVLSFQLLSVGALYVGD